MWGKGRFAPAIRQIRRSRPTPTTVQNTTRPSHVPVRQPVAEYHAALAESAGPRASRARHIPTFVPTLPLRYSTLERLVYISGLSFRGRPQCGVARLW